MDNKDRLVVVFSRNFATGLAVIRSIGSAGYTVDLVANAHKSGLSEIAMSSKYVRNHTEIISKKIQNGEDTSLIDELVEFAKGIEEKEVVLFPTDDYTASVMDLNRDVLKEYFIMPGIVGGKQGSMMEAMDKTVQGNLAREAGLLTPKEWIISLREEIDIPYDMVYPCFVKPIESATGYKTEMARCDDEDELQIHLSSLKRRYADRSILVQEFLEIDNEIDLSGVCLDDQVIIPAIIKKTHVAEYEKGVTLAGKVVPVEELGDVKDKVFEMLKKFRYFGMFDMELNIVGDKIYFNEVNFRSGGPNFSYFRSGVNLPGLFINEAFGLGHKEEDEKVKEMGKDFIYEKVAWDDYMNGFMTKKELKEKLAAADIQLLHYDEDPEPGKLFDSKINRRVRRRRIRAIEKGTKRVIKRTFINPVKPALRTVKHTALGYPQMKKENQRDPNAQKPRVVISGRNYCSNLCMARSLGEAGYECEVLRIFQVRPKKKYVMRWLKPDAYSKYVKNFKICVSKRRSKRIKNALLKMADPDRKMLLIPADDLVANVADQYYDELSEFYYIPNVNETAGEINRLMSKGVQKELAIQAGLPVVGSCVIKTIGGKFEIPDTVNYPCFIKPNISKNSSKSRMRKIDSREELQETLTQFSRKKDIEMIVEDFVEIEREYSILGVSTKDGANGPGFFGAEVGGQAEHRGVALLGRMLPHSKYDDLVKQCIDFVGSLGFEGLYDIDLIETKDGKMYFVELNLRFGASGYAVTRCGVNLPGMFADYMIFGKPIDKDCKIRDEEKLFASEKVIIDEYTQGRISRKELNQYMDMADIHFIKNQYDPKPYNHFKKYYAPAGLLGKYHIQQRKKAEKEALKEIEELNDDK